MWLKVAMFSFVAELFLFLSKGMRWGGLVFKFRLSYWEYESAALRGKFALANLFACFFDVACTIREKLSKIYTILWL